jgi:sRNA-binding protein
VLEAGETDPFHPNGRYPIPILDGPIDIDRYELSRFLKWWCSRPDYRDAIACGETRVNLDGSDAGLPTPEQQEHAARQVYGARADKFLARIRARQTQPDSAAP